MSTSDGPPLLARSIFGRAGELDSLRRLLAGGVEPAALALVGEAGIGKTRLASWAADAAREQGRAVLQGGTHLGLPEPLGVIRDAVRGALRAGLAPPGDDPVAGGLPPLLLPELGGVTTLGGGDAGALAEATIRYLAALGGDRGLLAVLEDLHWADPASLTLIARLARTLPPGVALLVTFRPDEDAGAAALERLRGELSRMRVRELALGPLGADESAEMLEELIGTRPPPDVADELIRLSGGNPFALEELARAVVESGWIDPATGARQSNATVAVPWTLGESIRARCSRLASAEGEALRWAAVIGEHFDVRLLAAAAGLDDDAALTALAGCVAAGLVAEDTSDPTGHRFLFRHALVHEALVQERLVAERARRHAAVLAAAERLAAAGMEIPPAELVRHAAAAGDRSGIVVHGRAAAAQAYEVGAVEEAVGHLELALARWDPADGDHLRVDLLLDCGRLRARLARGDERAPELLQEARDAALALGDPQAAAVALVLLADARFECGEREEALADWKRGLGELRASGPADAIPQALAGYARGLGLQGEPDAANAAADEGLRLLPAAATADQARVRVSLLTTRGMSEMLRFRVDEGRPLLVEAARLAVEYQDDLGAARAHHILGANFFAVPTHEAAHHFHRAAELVRRHGLRGLEGWYVALEGWCAVYAGDWTAAGRLLVEAEELVAGGGDRAAWTRMIVCAARAVRLGGLGDTAAARVESAAAAAIAEEIGSPTHRSTAAVFTAGLDFFAGDLEAALAGIGSFAGVEIVVDALELDNWLVVVEVLAAAGEPGDARRVASAVRAMYDSPWADYAAAVAEAGAAPPAELVARVRAAVAAVAAIGHGYEAARMSAAAGVVAARCPEGRDAAAALARDAHERFGSLGSIAWCRRLEGTMRELGAPLTRRGGGAGGLTRREIEVLEALAEGLTNRGIAERLVISESTAIRHVANIYGKLGANNRAAAVRIAGERGLIASASGEAAA